jgi:hypothetical protein
LTYRIRPILTTIYISEVFKDQEDVLVQVWIVGCPFFGVKVVAEWCRPFIWLFIWLSVIGARFFWYSSILVFKIDFFPFEKKGWGVLKGNFFDERGFTYIFCIIGMYLWIHEFISHHQNVTYSRHIKNEKKNSILEKWILLSLDKVKINTT